MKAKQTAVLLFLMTCYVTIAHSQITDRFTIDSTTNSIKLPLPFDRPFILNFQGSTAKTIYTGFLLEWVVNGSTRELKNLPNGKLVLQRIIPAAIKQSPNGNGVDVLVQAQPPNKSFAFLAGHHFDGELMDEVMKVNFLIYQSKPADANKLLSALSSKVASVGTPLGVEYKNLGDVSLFAFNWTTNVATKQVDGKGNLDVNASVVKGYNSFYSTLLTAEYAKLGGLKLIVPSELDLQKIQAVIQAADALKIPSNVLYPVVSLSSRKRLQDVLNGTISINTNLSSDNSEEWDFKMRIDNISASLKTVEDIIQLCELLEARSVAQDIKDVKKGTFDLRTILAGNLGIIKEVNSNVRKKIADNTDLTYSTWAIGYNEIWDLKTKGTYYLIPDLGVVSIWGLGREKNELIVRPYIGASIYFRQVDKNVPFKYFDKRYRFYHHFSLNLGLTVSKIEKGEFSDLFNNMSLLVGGNYKIIREVSVSAGAAVLLRKNVNPAIDDKQTRLSPYFGLSIDLDFMNSIQKLTSKVF